MSSDDGSYSPDSNSAISNNTEYESDFIEYLSSSDEESNNLLFKDELEQKQERKRKKKLAKYEQMCKIDQEIPNKKRSLRKPILERTNKREPEAMDDTAITNVRIRDMDKKGSVFTHNINVPKSADVIIINLKKRDKQNTQIVCNLNKPNLLHQSDTEIIVSSN